MPHRLKQDLVLFVVGGLLLSLCDRVHVMYGVIVQNDQSFLGQAWWVPPMFGVVTVVTMRLYALLRPMLGARIAPASRTQLVTTALALASAYVVTGPGAARPMMLAGGLAALWAFRAMARRSLPEVWLALLIAVVGPAVEALTSASGAFRYVAADFLYVPMWLPAVYLHAAPLVVEIDGMLHGLPETPPLERTLPT